METHLPKEAPPFWESLYQMAPSLPRAKTVIVFVSRNTAAGDEVGDPPREFHADHPEPCDDV